MGAKRPGPRLKKYDDSDDEGNDRNHLFAHGGQEMVGFGGAVLVLVFSTLWKSAERILDSTTDGVVTIIDAIAQGGARVDQARPRDFTAVGDLFRVPTPGRALEYS